MYDLLTFEARVAGTRAAGTWYVLDGVTMATGSHELAMETRELEHDEVWTGRTGRRMWYRVESYSGMGGMERYDWYLDGDLRRTMRCASKAQVPPAETDADYTHTLLFLHTPERLLLAKKLRGFATDTYNGIGGKVNTGESAVECILRETHEEVHLTLVPDKLSFAGSISIHVDHGESVKIAVFTQRLQEDDVPRAVIKSSDEVHPTWIPKHHLVPNTDHQPFTGKMRPEHNIYLACLLNDHIQPHADNPADKGVLISVKIAFHAEPSKLEFAQAERPENHRTIRQWSLDVFYNSETTFT